MKTFASRLGSALAIALMTAVGAARAADGTYIYDDLGRLKAVVDPATDASIYAYDAVGNLLGIERRSATLLSLLEFSPKCGSSGSAVNLYGTAFSPTASQNTVTIGGVAASVTSASVTKLVVTVPSGASSGPVTVTTPTGSTTSSQSFTGICS